MGLRVSLLWIVGACVLSFSCGDSTSDPGGVATGGASGASGRSGAGSANQSGAAHGGGTAAAGADSANAGQAGARDPSEAGSAGESQSEGGTAGEAEAPARFEPWALWPMPNAASAGLTNPALYDTSTAGVVRDQVTGLVWQRSVSSSTYDWSSAKTYCARLVLAGFSDWRLPSRIELISIVDYTIAMPGPVIDAVAFPDTPNTLFWTASTLPLYGTSRAWYVEFDTGFAFSESSSVPFNARCVR